jgi:shikimate dehydrogenase
VLGSPVAHSLSPQLHLAAYAALGLRDWRYERVEMTAERLPAFLAGLTDEWVGLSLTMPLKQTVLPLLESLSPLAGALGVVNTVTFGPDRELVGDNTDVPGIVAALREAGASSVDDACVLGGGATAASAVAALLELGCASPVLVVRSCARAAAVVDAAARLGAHPRLVPWSSALDVVRRGAEVVVSTVPAGAADELAASLAQRHAARPLGTLLDVVYLPWPTPLGRAWAAGGGAVLGGFPMLLHQAVGQVRLMTGLEPPVEAMRAAGIAALAARAP